MESGAHVCMYVHVRTYIRTYVHVLYVVLRCVVLEELSKAMADKEALEKHCHQLQRTNSELKEELSRAVSQSISLQEHKAALDEIQE